MEDLKLDIPQKGKIMRWPYNARVDAVQAWGSVTGGIAIGGIIVGAVAATHGVDPHFHWWWPTNWLIIPVGIVVIGMVMVVVPLRRHDDRSMKGRLQAQAVADL